MAQSYVALYFHVVFSTKDRVPLIRDEWRDRLYGYIGGIARPRKCALLKAGGVADHVHLLLSTHQDVAISDLIRDLKANSSGWVHEDLGVADFAWQSGYGAFTVSVSMLDAVKAYIERQPEHHRRQTFQEELLDLLRRHQIEFDERYVFQ